MSLLRLISGAFRNKPSDLENAISCKSRDLIRRVFESIDPQLLLDYHTHIAGVGAGGTDALVNSRMLSWKYPFDRFKFKAYLSACAVTDKNQADIQLINRLQDLIQNIPAHGKHCLLAFDKNYFSDGSVNLEKTEFYVPNEYVFQLAANFPDLFLPVMSVHPFRIDALEQLDHWAARGGRIVKWLPNAMGMNPADPKCDPFYQKMKELELTLLSHGGEEKAVRAKEDQKLGNPLLLRRPLELGVKVIVAHCASLGQNEDLDHPKRTLRTNFDLFLRLMDNPKYEGLLFGEISAMTQFNRIGTPLMTMLRRTDLHPRLVNGSDYPLPAFNILIRTAPLIRGGFLSSDDATCLKEIYNFNPLLFDFALKRCLRVPGTDIGFADSVFLTNSALL